MSIPEPNGELVSREPLHSKYLTAILTAAVTVGTALATVAHGSIGLTEVVQLVLVALGAVAAYIVPVLPGGWRGGVKVGAVILAAVLTAAVPFLLGGWSLEAVVIVILAGINALAAQLGVAVRVDAES